MDENKCLTCKGSRLRKEARFFKINELNIAELAQMDLDELYAWFDNLPQFLSVNELKIGEARWSIVHFG